jgi:hypothetical protein
MVHNTQNQKVSRLCPSSGILRAWKHNGLETGSVSSSGEKRETPTLLGPLERANLNHKSSFRNDVFSSYLEFRAMDKVQKPIDSENKFS